MASAYRISSEVEGSEDDSGSEKSFDWAEYLLHNSVKCVPVDSFSTAPLSKEWNYVAFSDLIVEVELKNTHQNGDNYNKDSYWLGSTAEFCGYMTKINYLGVPDDPRNLDLVQATWKNFASEIFRIGYASFHKYNLIPPFEISLYYPIGDFREHIVKTITGRFTLHPNIQFMKTNNNSNSKRGGIMGNGNMYSRFAIGSYVEILDKSNTSQMKLGIVDKIFGHRLHVKYWDCKDADEGLWCNDSSQSVQMCGWSNAVGHPISAPIDYNPPEIKPLDVNNGVEIPDIKIHVGMKLEVVDPRNLLDICAATVAKVLNHGYFLVTLDHNEIQETKSNRFFCYHILSNMIFPCGFCKLNNIPFTRPIRWKKSVFEWKEYFKITGSVPLNLHGIRKENIEHNFKVGYKLEAVDAGNPNLICVATVSKVIGRLLRIHFDGWEDTYDQWADIESPDLFPVGWCQLKGCKLESPPKKSAAHKVQSSEKTGTKVASRKLVNVYSVYDETSEPEDDVPMSSSPPSVPFSEAITKTSTSPPEPKYKPSTEILIASKDPEQQIVGAVYALGSKIKPKPRVSQDMIRQLLRVKERESKSFMSSCSKNNFTKE